MPDAVARRLLTRGLEGMAAGLERDLLGLTGRWPLLLNLVNHRLAGEVDRGAHIDVAVAAAAGRLRERGPAALDITDSGQRQTAVAATVGYSLDALDSGGRDRFLELGIFAEDAEIPLSAVALLWQGTAGLSVAAAESLCERLDGLSLLTRITQSITSEGPWRDKALAAVAAALAVTGPDRAERIAESVAPGAGFWRDEALAAVAAAFAVTGPDRAERIARSITFGLWAAEVLGAVAEAVRVSDPDRSRRLAVEAEGIAGSFTTSSEKGEAWARFAKALAATDPYEARSYAKLIMGAESKAAEVLAEVAKVLAATDPDEAENVARSIFNPDWKTTALTEVAKVLAATDPDRAERLAYAVTEVWRPQALAVIAVVLAGYHPVGLKVSLTEV